MASRRGRGRAKFVGIDLVRLPGETAREAVDWLPFVGRGRRKLGTLLRSQGRPNWRRMKVRRRAKR